MHYLILKARTNSETVKDPYEKNDCHQGHQHYKITEFEDDKTRGIGTQL